MWQAHLPLFWTTRSNIWMHLICRYGMIIVAVIVAGMPASILMMESQDRFNWFIVEVF